MSKTIILVLSGLFGLLIVAACNPETESVVTTVAASPTAQSTAEIKSLPTPISPDQPIVYNNLHVLMSEAEITNEYLTEYGSSSEPSPKKKFLWIHLILNNMSQSEQALPVAEHFSALAGETEFKSTYGHRKDHADYMALNTSLIPGQTVDAWLRFDIPDDMELKDLIFAFLPESTQVSFGFSSNEYFWADHPIYLWTCAPP